jgi:hypothetical protein
MYNFLNSIYDKLFNNTKKNNIKQIPNNLEKVTVKQLFTRPNKIFNSYLNFNHCYNENNYNIYHYTSMVKLNYIFKQKFIKPYKARIWPFKKAVYLTVLKPSENDQKLLENNYRGNTKFIDKIQCALRFDNRKLRAVKEYSSDNRDIWMVPEGILLDNFKTEIIKRK